MTQQSHSGSAPKTTGKHNPHTDKRVQGSVHSTTVCSRQETGTTAYAQTMMCPYCGTPLSPHKEASTAVLMTLGNRLLIDESQLQKNQTNKKSTHILILCEENFSNRNTQRQLRSVASGETVGMEGQPMVQISY